MVTWADEEYQCGYIAHIFTYKNGNEGIVEMMEFVAAMRH